MKKFLIDLTEQEAQQLTELARQHGNRLKPFAEYLLRLQLGAVNPPTVAPVALPPEGEPHKDEHKTRTNPAKVKPSGAAPKKDKPQEDEDPIKERFGVFQYKGDIYSTREEAEAAIRS